MPSDLRSLLERHLDRVRQVIGREGGGLLRLESSEDLVQNISLEVLRAEDRFRYEGDAAFVGFLTTIARRHLAGRRDYWNAVKRNAGHLLRISTRETAPGDPRSGVDPSDPRTGPRTFADRRDQLQWAGSVWN